MRIRVALKELLEARGESMYWLSKETGRPYASIWTFAKAERDGISFQMLEAICTALECGPGDILVLEEGEAREAKGGRPPRTYRRKAA